MITYNYVGLVDFIVLIVNDTSSYGEL